ncbi:MAG: hypothetical protein LBK67_03170 [Coriobacteriales bacterium]|nr:hypothetical protein [Coriobacteriales bacterium]
MNRTHSATGTLAPSPLCPTKSAGFDAYELNFAANNLGQSFFSRARNTRTDEYGPQTLESRTKFMVECISGIKQACGADFVVQLLINGVEENDGHLGDSTLYVGLEETKAIAKKAEEAGADSIHLRIGPAGWHRGLCDRRLRHTLEHRRGHRRWQSDCSQDIGIGGTITLRSGCAGSQCDRG